jgi:dTDP-4-amino-4,6-dideoxygalactose transaminase
MTDIPFNRPQKAGKEFEYIQEAIKNIHLSGNGPFTKQCQTWLAEQIGSTKVLLTHSCTAALEMAALLVDIKPGDEIIMPSFTFVSTANAFVLRGGIPVFTDIRVDTLNIDEKKLIEAITPRTKAIVPVHYAGVGCEMDAIMEIAQSHNLFVIEDAAQGISAKYKDQSLGGIGQLAALSFHETKNIISGEGGALLINDPKFVERAEIIWEKGTNRNQFFRGEVDKYTWVDIGSSFLPSEILAAFLWAQFEAADMLINNRLQTWLQYHVAFADLEDQGKLRRPQIPDHCKHNAHIYYLLLPDVQRRTKFIDNMRSVGVNPIFHYIPLHSSPAGKKFGRASGDLPLTNDISQRLVRLPMWVGMSDVEIAQVIDMTIKYLA